MAKRIIGDITLGGDKSLSHRAVMFAAMADGISRIRNLSSGRDVQSTIAVFGGLGTDIESSAAEVVVRSKGVGAFASQSDRLDCGNSGTTLRLALGILAGSRTTASLFGDASLNRRPVRRVMLPLTQMGAEIATEAAGDHPPVRVVGRRLRGIDYESPIPSAQVKSAVLLAALQAEGTTSYREPEPSRDHTERFLVQQGIDLQRSGNALTLRPGRKIAAIDYDVAGDISTAAFFIVAASLVARSELRIRDVLLNPTRTGALRFLERMGAAITIANSRERFGEPVGDVLVQSAALLGADSAGIPTASLIDEVPILAVAAMCAAGESRIRDIGELRVKESDRAQGIIDLLACYGCQTRVDGNDLVITGTSPRKAREPEHHHDHRLAMAAEIAMLVCGDRFTGAARDVIAISASEFYDRLEEIWRD